jgi:hypothetical protein
MPRGVRKLKPGRKPKQTSIALGESLQEAITRMSPEERKASLIRQERRLIIQVGSNLVEAARLNAIAISNMSVVIGEATANAIALEVQA